MLLRLEVAADLNAACDERGATVDLDVVVDPGAEQRAGRAARDDHVPVDAGRSDRASADPVVGLRRTDADGATTIDRAARVAPGVRFMTRPPHAGGPRPIGPRR